ncbi:MAG: amino acid ABC transporter substrate-binding protein [Curvibacter lanceolatus]|jgi:ABC-type amino acid transport substrate-binding protein|uniref:ABC transporter substrate-binding protein n=1 Tax=Curvibacter lanceolatus TaxID=86182 RepID=UPI0003A00977|nr:amino acid ABC transporter substrate-binding protein [Curvibacter lanceolatus]
MVVRFLAGWCLAMGLTMAVPTLMAGSVHDRVQTSKAVRVCIWPDYYGITYRNPRTRQLVGIDIDLAHELAADLSMKVEFVDSSFASLVPDLVGDRCDIAMFAVAMLAQRMQHLRFTRPYLRSDIYAITTRGSATIKQWADIDRPGILVGVQSGTFMEPVMAASLKYAKLINIKPPQTRERELEAGRIDVFMTDYPYSRRLLDNADWATLISPPKPFHVMPYGYAVKPGDESWYAVVDDFVARIQKDGRLESHARRHGLDSMVVQP